MIARESSSAASNEITQLRASLAEALKDREAAWTAQAKLVEIITELKKELEKARAR